MKHVLAMFSLLSGLVAYLGSAAQGSVQFQSKGTDTIRTVYIWHTDVLKQSKIDSLTTVQSLYGHVKLQNEKTLFYCDSVSINQSTNVIEAFSNVHIIDSDTTNIYSQYMKYYVDKKQITFQKNVTLTDGKGVLTTDELQYDLNQHIGNYTNGGKVIDGSTVITSLDGVYFADAR